MHYRIKWLKVIAQITDQKPVISDPQPFIASNNYTTISIAYGSTATQSINKLIDLINNALFHISNGKFDFHWMKSNNFSFGVSDISIPELKCLMQFSKTIYYFLLNNGQPFKNPLTKEQIKNRIDLIKQSQDLNSLPSTIYTKSKKVPNNLKTLINNYLTSIK